MKLLEYQLGVLRGALRAAMAPSRALDEALFAWAGARLCCDTDDYGEAYYKIWRFGGHVWLHPPRFTASLDAAMTLLPQGWWVYRMEELRTPITFKGDIHAPSGHFAVDLQHVNGGRRTGATGPNFPIAFCRACVEVAPIIEPKGMPALLFPPGFMGSRSWP